LLQRYHFRMQKYFKASRHVALACSLGLGLFAQQASALFVVNQPWVLPAQKAQTTEAFMNLTSTDGATLVGATSAAAATVAILAPGKTAHAIDRVSLPAHTVITLAPGSYRIVMHRLAQPLKLGDRVELTLTIEAADGTHQEVGVNADVRLHAPIYDELHEHKHAQ
jgi:copper(I)-binding protein